MKIGIFTYGTRGDVQPYIGLALAIKTRGYEVLLCAPENFEKYILGFGLNFHALYGNAEEMMNLPEGQKVLKTENSIQLMKYFFKVLNEIKIPLRKSYLEGINQVDCIIANSATMSIVSAIAEKQNKKMALTYFMPPLVETREFPVADFDFLNFPWYNKMTYRLTHFFYWKFVKSETNEFRKELGLCELKKNLITTIDSKKTLDLYCFSPTLIQQPKDWQKHHKITGFINIPNEFRQKNHIAIQSSDLKTWMINGDKPIYIGFGSNGVGNTEKIIEAIQMLLIHTNERILFCTGWSIYPEIPKHDNLYIVKEINHEEIFPFCKVGIFHGGAGTLGTLLRHKIPVIIISFYTDQPTWGKIIVKKGLGIHIPIKKLKKNSIIEALNIIKNPIYQENVAKISTEIQNEKGLEKAIKYLEEYFYL